MPQMFLGIGLALGTGNSKAVVPNAPVNTVNPTITGTPAVGATLTATSGTWTGTAPITYEYQWERNGADIAGATTTTHLVDALDEGANLQIRVTATNAAGSDVAYSLPFEIPIPGRTIYGPRLVTAPAITFNVATGKLDATDGVWDANPPATISFTWVRNGEVVSGHTVRHYTVTHFDSGKTIHALVLAQNSAGKTFALSNAITIP